MSKSRFNENLRSEMEQLRHKYDELKTAYDKKEAEQKQTVEELTRCEQKYLVLFKKSAYPIALSKLPEGVIVDVNDAFEQEFGYTKNEVVGKTSSELGINLNEEGRKQFLKKLKDNDLEFHKEVILRSKSGEECFYETNIEKVIINGEDYLINTVLNISEYKSVENKLKENYDLIRIAGEKAKLGGWNVILEEDRSYWSDELAAIHEMPAGYSPLVEDGINFYAPEWRDRITEVFTKCAQEGIPYDEEMQIITATGKRVWVRTIGEAVRDKNGNIFKIQGAFQNITLQKQSELELTRISRIMKNAQEIAHLGSFEYVAADKSTIWSEEEYHIYGLDSNRPSPSYDEMLKKSIHPEDAELLDETFKSAIKNNGIYELEHRIVRPDGSVRWVHDKARPYFDENGKLLHYIGATLDITERKQAEEELLKSKRYLEEYFENDISADYVTSVGGEIFSCNKTFVNLFGFENKSKTKKFDISKLYRNPEDRKKLIRLVEKHGKVENHEMELISNEGKIIYALINAIGIFNEYNELDKIRGYIVDISEQKKIEDELKKSEEKYRLLFANNPQPMWIYDLETLAFLEVNEAAINHYGYSKAEFLSMTLKDIRPVEDISTLMKDIKKTRSDFNAAGEWRHIKKSGEIIDVEITSHSVVFNDRNARHVLINDITERKYYEKELLKLSRAVEQSPTSIIITDFAGNIEYVNPKTLEITGYTKEELIGKNPRIFNSGEKPKEEYLQLWSTIQSGKEWSGEFLNKKKNGELYWEYAFISPIINDKKEILNYVAIKENITERKNLVKIQDILINISDAIVASPNLQVFFKIIFKELTKVISTQNIYIAEYNEREQVFRTVFMFDELDESISEFPSKKTMSGIVVREKKSQLIDKKFLNELIEKGEVELFGPPSEVWIGVPILSGGKAIGVMAIQNYAGEKNLTVEDMKLLEYAAPTISLAIERKKTFEDLKSAKEKAEESDRLKSAFLANMSHEIRTPMNGILGFTELLLNPDLSSEEKENFIEVVHQSGQRMLNTVTDIVEISKIEAGMVKVIMKEIDLNKHNEELVNFFNPEAGKKGLKLIMETWLAEEKKNVLTDENKFDSILTNLIKNAIKYTESGTIQIGCQAKGDFLEFYVSDTGIGIPKNRMEAIFNRFEQADIADTRAFEGSGLGLAIAKSYVEMLGGKIWVESQEGKGSTFYFTLPPTDFAKEKSIVLNETSVDNENNKIKLPKRSLKILLAEDDEPSRNYISIIVNDFSAETLEALTGIETVEICRNTKNLDLILMDIQMPGMNGYEATRRIREFNKDVVIIAQTAFAISGDREKALEAGCNDYITKPIRKADLHKLLYKYFG